MRKQPIVLIIILILVGLVVVGCRVKSAAEDAEPTKSNNVAISYRSDGGQGITGGGDVTQEATEEIGPTDTIAPSQTPIPTETNTPIPTVETPGIVVPTNTQAVELPTEIEQPTEIAVLPAETNTPTIFVPTNTSVPTNTITPIPTNTATPIPPTNTPTNTPLPTFTSTPSPSPTPLITPTITPFVAIGGGATVIAQDDSTPSTDGLNANQLTATAFWILETQTIQAQQGTVVVPNTEFGTTPGTPTPSGIGTEVFPDCEHYVDPGATLSQISRLYHDIDVNYIASYNNLDNIDYIKAGTYLLIPGCGLPVSTPTPTVDPQTESAAAQPDPDNSQVPVQYTIQAGDNIYRLSVRFGVTMAELVNANPTITDINLVSVGQVITIPPRSQFDTTETGLTPTPTPNQGGTVG